MTLRERIKTEETKVGKFLIWFIGIVGLVASTIGMGLEFIGVIPQDWIPNWLKVTIVICAIIGGTIGKLTAKKQ